MDCIYARLGPVLISRWGAFGRLAGRLVFGLKNRDLTTTSRARVLPRFGNDIATTKK